MEPKPYYDNNHIYPFGWMTWEILHNVLFCEGAMSRVHMGPNEYIQWLKKIGALPKTVGWHFV